MEAELRELAGSVPDPELPVLTLAELGVLRDLRLRGPGRAEVELTPTYTGCPAVETMAADIRRVLGERGIPEVAVRTVLAPPWTTDAITPEGRRKLAEAGIAPPRPGAAAHRTARRPVAAGREPGGQRAAEGPVPVELAVRCPRCGSTGTTLLSRFSSTACTALRRCVTCGEPFDHMKEV
ncbi:1,2-phenylacetyl-CoA epoxidase subunit PaaD [Streptomyces sp. B1866]|uniref:1,2-phenylacetyl-CoA epoxidase subunit PaaD n=1 Tax=Streptomyces sp. B1866 TaxID=3075431 RepID=UPI0028911242|nr:1,2-phenylacetyl-CoA epoxidase subunit PaaD [Streptomyces sp. B1866]MDT3398281.1 1,2-phenylacetyl-CoA epoxidase subunit PaaD [Streptomyces sp. B1866]